VKKISVKTYVPNNSGVGLPVGLREKTTGPSLSYKVRRAFDAGITRAQDRLGDARRFTDTVITRVLEWLESDDTAGQKIAAFTLIGICAAYVAGQLIMFIGRLR